MGRHTEWRKIAKRERRRKIRTLRAKERDKVLQDESWIKEQEMLEIMVMEQIEQTNSEENEKWLCAEKKALEEWKILQEHRRILQQEKIEQEAKRKLEWEKEKKRKKEEKERLKAIEEANRIKQELFIQNLEEFLSGDAREPPEALKVVRETRPGGDMCPFFSKTATCRFGDQCSRNHQYPAISKVLLATNFYSHFGLNNTTQNEYDTDIMLEYEDSETYTEYKEFFYDVISELEKFGKIVQFRVSITEWKALQYSNSFSNRDHVWRSHGTNKAVDCILYKYFDIGWLNWQWSTRDIMIQQQQAKVCNNYEKHLRGNMYIEYASLRCAVAAYRALQARWYAGRRLSMQFCFIPSWKNAVCGMQLKKRCPKGTTCNFLHVFRNPKNLFTSYNTHRIQTPDSERSRRTPPRSWRWSESPEVEIPRKSRREEDRSERRHRERKRDRSRERDSKRYRSRRSSERDSNRK